MNRHGRTLVFGLLVGMVFLGGCGWSTLNVFHEPTFTLQMEDPETGEPLSGYAFLSLHTYPDFYERNPEFSRHVKKIGPDGKLTLPAEEYQMVKGEVFTGGHEKVGFSHAWSPTESGWRECEQNVWYQLKDHEGYDEKSCGEQLVLTPRDVTGDSEAWYESFRYMPPYSLSFYSISEKKKEEIKVGINQFQYKQMNMLMENFNSYPDNLQNHYNITKEKLDDSLGGRIVE